MSIIIHTKDFAFGLAWCAECITWPKCRAASYPDTIVLGMLTCISDGKMCRRRRLEVQVSVLEMDSGDDLFRYFGSLHFTRNETIHLALCDAEKCFVLFALGKRYSAKCTCTHSIATVSLSRKRFSSIIPFDMCNNSIAIGMQRTHCTPSHT